MLQKLRLMERKLSCYRGGQFNGGSIDHITEVACFNGARMVILHRWLTLMEGEWSCYGGEKFKGRRMVMLRKLSL